LNIDGESMSGGRCTVGGVQGKEMKRERYAILAGQEERKKNVCGRRKKAKRNVTEDVSREQRKNVCGRRKKAKRKVMENVSRERKKARHDVDLAER